MCGIAGRYNWKSGKPAERAELQRMAERLRHRGPDGEGFHLAGPLGLAHRRLAIIDLEGGVQPMATADEKLWIVFNGEIFNYVELREELAARGHVPRTHSDTETILFAYREWGLEFPSRLNGMFAIALWDAERKRLVLCRDRMGVKPLYTAETDDGVLFASEIKALRGSPGVDTTLDLESLDEYMTLGYVVHPRCMVRGVKKLEPGTLAVYEPGKPVATRRYWSLRFEPDHGPDEREWRERVRALFDDAVRIRLRSDVPLGVLLSGGVDSTAIATTIARVNRGGAHGMDSFCIGVDVPGAVTEFAWARRVADLLGTRHHEERLSAESHGEVLLDAAKLLDEPLAESMVGQLLAICRTVRRHVTVVLSGEGSDETWFGYTAYRTMYAIERLQKLAPRALLDRLGPALAAVAGRVPMSSKLQKYLRLATEPLERRYLGLNYFDTAVKDRVYSGALRGELAGRDAREAVRRLYDEAGGPETISRMAAVDCRAWLVDNTLLRSDLMSMAASVELRVPFMDYRLVELAAKVPARFKVEARSQKVILKKALADRLPPEVVHRKKVGFPTPLPELFRSSWGQTAEEVILEGSRTTEALFDRAVLGKLFAEHRAGRNDWSRILFQVLMLEYWAREGERADRAAREPGATAQAQAQA